MNAADKSWAVSTEARERLVAFDRRNGGRFPASWLLSQSDADIASLRGWLREKLDAQIQARKPWIRANGPEASARFWRMALRARALCRQLTQVRKESDRRLGIHY